MERPLHVRRLGVSFATTILCFAMCSSALVAQRTWNVGPGALPEIQDAIDLAVSGDEILVAPGTYGNFLDEKGVTIRSTAGRSRVFVAARFFLPGMPGMFPSAATRLNAPQGERSHLIGLDFLPGVLSIPGFGAISTHHIELWSDAILEDCEVVSTQASGAILTRGGLAQPRRGLTLIDTSIAVTTAGSPGISVADTDLTISGGSISGGSSSVVGRNAGPAIYASPRCSVQLSAVTLNAGTAVAGSVSAPAVRMGFGSELWMTDCALIGDPTACPVGFVGSAPNRVTFARTTSSSPLTGCASAVEDPNLIGITRAGPFRSVGTGGAPPLFQGQIDVTGAAGANIVLALAGSLSVATQTPLHVQPFWLSPGEIFPVANLTVDAQGEASFPFAVPYTPALEGLAIWFQAVGVSRLPVQVSPLVGGVLIR